MDQNEKANLDRINGRKAISELIADLILNESDDFVEGVRRGASDFATHGSSRQESDPEKKEACKKPSGRKLHDDSIMEWGKYRNFRLGDIPDDYWVWFLGESWSSKWPDYVEYANCIGD